MLCNIITIGEEILIGQITDTNQPYIAKELNKIGISVNEMLSVTDKKTSIINALEYSFKQVDLVIITGGLGPTNDDITKQTLTFYFNDKLVLNNNIKTHLKQFYDSLNFKYEDKHLKQAILPSKAKIFKNYTGTAPGMWFENGKKIAISLPGVPTEMKHLMQESIIPSLQKQFKLPYIFHKTLVVYGERESEISDKLSTFEQELPRYIRLAYLPNYNYLRLRLSTKGDNKNQLEDELKKQTDKLLSILKSSIINHEDFKIEVEIAKILINRKQTLSVAESFTGGNIAHTLTLIPRASEYFKGGIVCYSANIKQQELNIPKHIIQQHTVVSPEVAEAMAKNIQKKYNTDYAIATTGNAGPTKDKTDKSLGSVYIAIATPKYVKVYDFNLGQPRDKVIQKGTAKALELIYKTLI